MQGSNARIDLDGLLPDTYVRRYLPDGVENWSDVCDQPLYQPDNYVSSPEYEPSAG